MGGFWHFLIINWVLYLLEFSLLTHPNQSEFVRAINSKAGHHSKDCQKMTVFKIDICALTEHTSFSRR